MNAQATPLPDALDPHTYSLIDSLKEALEAERQAGSGVLSRASKRLCEHLLERYSVPVKARFERVALAPWQERKAKEILAANLSSRLFIADVAEQCALSRSHFSRAFKKATGMSPQEWVLDQRIQRAKHLLSSSQLPISHISQECGFADQSHFCRTFSKWVGAAPNAWRRLNASSAASAFAHCGVTRTGNTARDKVR